MKNCDKKQKSTYLEYLDASNLYGWPMRKKLPVNGFKWISKLDEFNENFIKKYNEDGEI